MTPDLNLHQDIIKINILKLKFSSNVIKIKRYIVTKFSNAGAVKFGSMDGISETSMKLLQLYATFGAYVGMDIFFGERYYCIHQFNKDAVIPQIF